MLKKNKVFLMFLILTFFGNNIFAQNQSYREYEISVIESSLEEKTPLWLLLERGKQAYRLGEFGLSTRIFREVLNRQKISPDADMWLARIFMQEGEYSLAEKQYLIALENKYQLYVLEDQFEIKKELINLYKITNQYGKYEKTLITTIEENESDKNIIKLQYDMVKLLNNQGIDKLFNLYRYFNIKSNTIRTELGIFYYKTGRYTEAEAHLVLPLISVASNGYKYLNNKDIDYSYYNFSEHISNMLKIQELEDFAENNNFFENIYYLAASFYANGNTKISSELWYLVVDSAKQDSLWWKKSKKQLENPYIEPIITNH